MAMQAVWWCVPTATLTSNARHQMNSCSASSQSSLFKNVLSGWRKSGRSSSSLGNFASAGRVAEIRVALQTGDRAAPSSSGSQQAFGAAVAPSKGSENVDAAGGKFLLGKSEEELVDLAVSLGEQKYRGRQIHQLLYKTRASSIDDFHHLPKVFKEALVSEGWQVGRSPTHHVARSADGTIKVLLRLPDNLLVETVGIPVQDKAGAITRLTACVSSQVGCALRCAFCATGKGGFSRNLKPHEIVEQVLAVEDLFKHRVSNVVFMGMGEPMMNLTNVLAAHRSLNKDILIGQRMMTISTVGVPNTLAKLATHKLQSTLAISLHAPNQELRSQIVPSAKGYPLEALLSDCRKYFLETGRRVSFEYTLLDGVNDKPEHAEELANLLNHWKLGRHVNVIPYNPIADSEFRRPKKAAVMAFVEALGTRKVTASIRQTRGLDANAACGQLRNDFQKIPIPVAA
ncbi:23S rRNA (adenine2503-C2)-methyltransferase [Marchantia polymorpha subsp. ruderalis]|uniref:Radical SAM core domain-containing protein n=2 Tax=Marchantia polymorpha TaxID=3197 RepID=A0A176VCE7_MARPO|nr:hypothetical protein AXG93_1923s1440 [Marchantia polymorpha subsp. ruderalis]PTQ48516.1 hypothetical protein MARPO_0005s0156 [Marchantia polymorpha]BBM97291.1 hypothetical protein Mp_1g04510 [Marchantia polymorpha subsp. ruderalis]|eukprot:PTQ48516.1 hypothetical protein MARPO_0005s0156 [Marchantia polymorpha]